MFESRAVGSLWGAAFLILLVLTGTLSGCERTAKSPDFNAGLPIQPAEDAPYFWSYGGQRTLLIGGSREDNLFQLPDLEAHLDSIAAVGGNYVRATLSSRDSTNLWPFARAEDGRYDLRVPDADYYGKFEQLLRLASERRIVVQVELWDRFDFARGPWLENPFRPANNSSYEAEEVGLANEYPDHPGSNANPFFRSVPKLDGNLPLLKLQQSFIDRILEISLVYQNVLYCIDNETSGSPEWAAYWADYLKEREVSGSQILVTEMWDPWDIRDPQHQNTFADPGRFKFVDVSQNNHISGEAHWDRLQWLRRHLSGMPRPINQVKVYGADTGRYGSSDEGVARFWRSLIGGVAAVRFHRPEAGLGLSSRARASLLAASRLKAFFDFTQAEPDSAHRLLGNREENEAYLTRVADQAYLVFFPDTGAVTVDLTHEEGEMRFRWMDLTTGEWRSSEHANMGQQIELWTPDSRGWVALFTRERWLDSP